MFFRNRFRTLLSRFALVALVATAACDDDPVAEDDPADAVVALRLTVGTQIITVDEFGSVSGGPILVSVGSTQISASFLDENDNVVAGLDSEFRLDVESGNANVATFARTGAFTGNLMGVAVGQTTMTFELFHVEENHSDRTFTNVPVTVAIIGGAGR